MKLADVPVIKIESKVTDFGANLANVRISRQLGTVGTAQITLHMQYLAVGVEDFAPGADVEIELANKSDSLLFDGEITALRHSLDDGVAMLTVEAHDHGHRLGRHMISSSTMKVKAVKLLDDALRQCDLRLDDQTKGLLTKVEYPHFQVADTALAFLDEICQNIGAHWQVEGKVVTVASRSPGTGVVTIGREQLQTLDLRVSGMEVPKTASALGWDDKAQKTITGKSTGFRSVVAESGDSTAITVVRSDLKSREPALVFPADVVDQNDADLRSEGAVRRLAATAARGHGSALINRKIKPGVNLELNEINEDWAGTYFVNAVEHVFGHQRAFTTRFAFGPNTPDTSRRHGPSSSVGAAPLIGVVTETAFGEQGHEGPVPLVKVSFPTLEGTPVSGWMRTVTAGAGAARGIVAPHRVGDEVLVAFVNGSLNHPVVIGGLHSDETKTPPEGLELVNKAQNAMVAQFGMNHLQVVDKEDGGKEPGIHLKTETSTLEMSSEQVKVDAQELPIELLNEKASITIDAQGKLVIKATSITLETTEGAIELTAKGNLKAKAVGAQLSADGKFEIKGTGGLDLTSPAITNVKGTSTLNLN